MSYTELEVETTWFQTYKGHDFNVLRPKADMIDIEDIAHALSMICRFNGHVSQYYSVAQHSVLVASACSDEFALYGLLHDASEAYIGDVISPTKPILRNYQDIEHNIMQVICKKFGIDLTDECESHIKERDLRMLLTEASQLAPNLKLNFHKKINYPTEGYKFEIVPWSSEGAEETFLTVFEILCQKN